MAKWLGQWTPCFGRNFWVQIRYGWHATRAAHRSRLNNATDGSDWTLISLSFSFKSVRYLSIQAVDCIVLTVRMYCTVTYGNIWYPICNKKIYHVLDILLRGYKVKGRSMANQEILFPTIPINSVEWSPKASGSWLWKVPEDLFHFCLLDCQTPLLFRILINRKKKKKKKLCIWRTPNVH